MGCVPERVLHDVTTQICHEVNAESFQIQIEVASVRTTFCHHLDWLVEAEANKEQSKNPNHDGYTQESRGSNACEHVPTDVGNDGGHDRRDDVSYDHLWGHSKDLGPRGLVALAGHVRRSGQLKSLQNGNEGCPILKKTAEP